MKISFGDRPISQAPLEILNHLYYYTVQYGLSVRAFTGQHQKYWERFPQRLRLAWGNEAELDGIVKELEGLAAGAPDRLAKRQARKKSGWAEKEIVLNAQLMSVLAALPPKLLALRFADLTSNHPKVEGYRVVTAALRSDEGKNNDFVEPDLLLLGDLTS